MLRRLLFLASAAACLSCATEAAPIVIGSAGPWAEAYGLMNKRGIDLAVEEINAKGGIAGRPLQVLSRDDEGDGVKAAAIASEFVENREVIAVVGHVTSGAMMAAARVYDNELPAVATTATTPDLSAISPWVFRVISSDSANGLTIARFVSDLGVQSVAILYENNSYGRGLVEAFRRGYSGRIITVDPIPDDADASFEPYISWIRSRSPDLVFVAGTVGSGIAILREARRQRLRSAFIGGDGWTGIVADTAASEGTYVAAPFSPEDPRAAARRFVASFRERYGVEPDGNAALAYDATMLLARAISEVGPSRTKVRDWLAGLTSATAFAGVTGPIYFDLQGDVVGKEVVMTRVRRGELTVDRPGSGS